MKVGTSKNPLLVRWVLEKVRQKNRSSIHEGFENEDDDANANQTGF